MALHKPKTITVQIMDDCDTREKVRVSGENYRLARESLRRGARRGPVSHRLKFFHPYYKKCSTVNFSETSYTYYYIFSANRTVKW